jgi:hypothetical protein
MRRLIVALFAAALLNCIAASSQSLQESWGKQIFGPSEDTLKSACNLVTENPSGPVIGQLRQKLTSGKTLYFRSATWSQYGLCGAFLPELEKLQGEFFKSEDYQRVMTRTRVSVFIAVTFEEDQTNVSISLEDVNGKELLQLKPDMESNFAGPGGFDFGLVSTKQQKILDSVASFSILVTIKGKTERIRVDPKNYSAFIRS